MHAGRKDACWKVSCPYVQGFARNVLINAVCKIHRFLQFPTADRDPAGNFEKLTICRTARKGKKYYRPYCKVQLKMPYILPDYLPPHTHTNAFATHSWELCRDSNHQEGK